MQIPLIDLKSQYKQIKEKVEPLILEIIKSQNLILGKYNSVLEKSVKELINVKFAVPVASGSDALIISLKALELPPGSEVITTAYSFFSSASSIFLAGLKPVFVDIDSDTYNLDPELLESKITDKTRGILPVHLYGQCARMDRIMEIARKYDLFVVEDVAQSILAKINNSFVGSIGNAGTLSFYPSKNLGAFGDAGMILTNDQDIYEKIRMLHVHGSKDRYIHEMIGYNSRMDEIQAAVLCVKIGYIKSWTEKKRQIAKYYDKLFESTPVKIPFQYPNCLHVFNSYIINVDSRNELKDHLDKNGISTSIFYPLPLPYQPCFNFLKHSKGDFPNAEKASERTLAIPCYAELTKDQQEYIAEKIIEFYR